MRHQRPSRHTGPGASRSDRQRRSGWPLAGALLLIGGTLAGCAPGIAYSRKGIEPVSGFAVTDNETPYSQCLRGLSRLPGNNKPVVAVGEVTDKTGQIDFDEGGRALTQGVSEMVISAFAKTGKVNMVERLDLRIPLAEVKLAEQGRLERSAADYGRLPASDFIVIGALTELNYNIMSEGARLFVSGVGAGARTVVINVALDLRVVNARTFAISYVTTLQKQIYGFEVESGVFRFFGTTLIDFNAGRVQNEPLQLGVRSVVEMAAYQVMTDFLGLPVQADCELIKSGYQADDLEVLASDTPNAKEHDDEDA